MTQQSTCDFVGRLVGRTNLQVSRLARLSVGGLVGQLVGRLVGQLVGRLVGRLVGWLVRP